jgi:hypothetical protein
MACGALCGAHRAGVSLGRGVKVPGLALLAALLVACAQQPLPPATPTARFVANPLALAEPSPAASAMVIILPGQVADIESASGKVIRNSKDLLEYVLAGLRAEQNPNVGLVDLFESNGLVFAAARVSYYDTDYRLEVRAWVAATVRGERALVAVAGSPQEEFDVYLPLFQRMVRTLRLL